MSCIWGRKRLSISGRGVEKTNAVRRYIEYKAQDVLGGSLAVLGSRYLGTSAFGEGSDKSYRPAQIQEKLQFVIPRGDLSIHVSIDASIAPLIFS